MYLKRGCSFHEIFGPIYSLSEGHPKKGGRHKYALLNRTIKLTLTALNITLKQ